MDTPEPATVTQVEPLSIPAQVRLELDAYYESVGDEFSSDEFARRLDTLKASSVLKFHALLAHIDNQQSQLDISSQVVAGFQAEGKKLMADNERLLGVVDTQRKQIEALEAEKKEIYYAGWTDGAEAYGS